MTKKTDSKTGNSNSNEERGASKEARSHQLTNNVNGSGDPEFSGYNLNLTIAKLASLAKRVMQLANNEVGRKEHIEEERRMAVEQSMFMEYGFEYEFKYGNR